MDERKLLTRLFRYIQIDSESGSEGRMCSAVMEDLKGMGLSPVQDRVGEAIGSDGGNIYCMIPGELPGSPLLLTAHLDTVRPGRNIEPVLVDQLISSKGDTVLGGDDKSGVALIMELLDCVRTKKIPHRSLEVLFTVSEEVGLKGSQYFDYSILQSDQAIVMDSQGGFGDIKLWASGKNKLFFDVYGKAAHAGANPEDGVSAISVAAKAISDMKLLRIDEETTANIGSFIAEGSTNIVNAHVRFDAEVRSFSLDKLQAQCDHMIQCVQAACGKHGATCKYMVEEGGRPYRISEDHPLVKELTEFCKRMNIPYRTFGDGGGSDANNLALHGITAVALGCGMDKIHTANEILNKDIYLQAANALLDFIT